MKLQEGYDKLLPYKGKRFEECFPDRLNELNIGKNGKGNNKGLLGNIIQEAFVGLSPSNRKLDFEDGELKIIPMVNGRAKETTCITMMSSSNAIDEYLDEFKNYAPFFDKIKNLIAVFVNQSSAYAGDWYIEEIIHASIDNPKFESWYKEIKKSADGVKLKTLEQIKSGDMMHTKGLNQRYVEIRTKGSKRADGTYPSLFSNRFNRVVSDKGRALFLKKECINDLYAMK